jgi:hypothetical protein
VFFGIIAAILTFVFPEYILVLIAFILVLPIFCLAIFIGAIALGILLFAFCAVIFAGAMILIGGISAFSWGMWLSFLYSEEWENDSPLLSLDMPYKTASQPKKKMAYPLWRKTVSYPEKCSREVLIDRQRKR